MMEESRLYWLLVRKHQAQLTEEEKAELVAKNPDPALEAEVARLWTLTTRDPADAWQPDTERALQRLHSRVRGQRLQVVRRRWAIAATILLLLTAAGWWLLNPSAGANPQWVTQQTGPGEQRTLTLADGSTVTLNANSQVTYLNQFAGAAERRVELVGEAFFAVTPNHRQPFRITTAGASTLVLGTSFNVRAYPGEAFTEVAVATGRVSLTSETSGNSAQLNAGQTAVADHAGVHLLPAAAANHLAWHTGRLYFKDSPLAEVLPLLERYYGVTFELDTPSATDCTITADWRSEKLADVLTALRLFTQLSIEPQADPRRFRVAGRCR